MDQIQERKKVVLGKYYSYWTEHSPRRLLYHLAYYKFAAKIVGRGRRVLDVGCNEGMGTQLLAKECGFAQGIDFDEYAICQAKKNWSNENTEFVCDDIFRHPSGQWDAVISFDVIEHILPENMDTWWECISENLVHDGIAIIGSPSLSSKKYASEITNRGHVNLYCAERLEKEIRSYFSHVFLFSANDEVIHTGFFPLAHYYIALCCQKKNNK